MNEDNFNMSIRKFLKMTGVGSQREIEQAVAKALADGKLEGIGKLPVSMKPWRVRPCALPRTSCPCAPNSSAVMTLAK